MGVSARNALNNPSVPIPGCGPAQRRRRHRSSGKQSKKKGSGLLGFPEDLRDLLDLLEELVGDGGVGGALGTAGAGQLGGLVEEGVQLGVGGEVRGLK